MQYIFFSFSCRLSELIALVSLSTTVFLFIHTRSLADRLNRVREPFDPSAGTGKSSEVFHNQLGKEFDSISRKNSLSWCN